jgi:hypothetical protein
MCGADLLVGYVRHIRTCRLERNLIPLSSSNLADLHVYIADSSWFSVERVLFEMLPVSSSSKLSLIATSSTCLLCYLLLRGPCGVQDHETLEIVPRRAMHNGYKFQVKSRPFFLILKAQQTSHEWEHLYPMAVYCHQESLLYVSKSSRQKEF